jgi:hypothetical protein
MTNRDSRKAGPTNLAEPPRKAGLVIGSVDSEVISRLFVEIEKYDSRERAEAFAYLKRALNGTRSSLGAEAVYREG